MLQNVYTHLLYFSFSERKKWQLSPEKSNQNERIFELEYRLYTSKVRNHLTIAHRLHISRDNALFDRVVAPSVAVKQNVSEFQSDARLNTKAPNGQRHRQCTTYVYSVEDDTLPPAPRSSTPNSLKTVTEVIISTTRRARMRKRTSPRSPVTGLFASERLYRLDAPRRTAVNLIENRIKRHKIKRTTVLNGRSQRD